MKWHIPPFFIILLCTLGSFTPPKTSQVYFMRPYRYTGWAIPYKIYIDDTLVCNLNNQRFSLHAIEPGEHIVTIQGTGISTHKRSEPLKITVKEGQSNYLLVSTKKRLHLEEVGQASAEPVMAKLKSDPKCLE